MRESVICPAVVRSPSRTSVLPPHQGLDVMIEGEQDGSFDGRSVTVLQGASITGDLGGDTIEIYGMVRGRVRGRAVHLRPTGRIEGEVEYGTLKVDPGATLNARCVPC
ncbi:MAG: polymer-forming cytoskeletal protein [Rhodospirillales bacterium]|jgi:cytoskeletal protein CcmA (bactofilin family)|nr:polymer-forming cytoskeletal protein [Rhodospirillales bacterium]